VFFPVKSFQSEKELAHELDIEDILGEDSTSLM
jgi:hypothetical protein